MILYLDASALAKAYLQEAGSADVLVWTSGADALGTSLITRAEVAAGIAKSVRVGYVRAQSAAWLMEVFRLDWTKYARLPVTEEVVDRADRLTWKHGLRGYDAVHLASALEWQNNLAAPVVFVAFDRALLRAATQEGLDTLPAPADDAG